jgi:4-oxalocrotonate tautomerase
MIKGLIRKENLMPVIQITMREGRPPEKKEELIKNVTETVSSTLGIRKEGVHIVLLEIPKDNFGHGGIPLSKMIP